MTPLPPALPPAALAPADPNAHSTSLNRGAGSPDAPALGAAAVTPAQAVRPVSARADLRDDPPPQTTDPPVLEPPQDPPPVKGLGIPPLNMTRVGDQDKPADQTGGRGTALPTDYADTLAATDDPSQPQVDIRR